MQRQLFLPIEFEELHLTRDCDWMVVDECLVVEVKAARF